MSLLTTLWAIGWTFVHYLGWGGNFSVTPITFFKHSIISFKPQCATQWCNGSNKESLFCHDFSMCFQLCCIMSWVSHPRRNEGYRANVWQDQCMLSFARNSKGFWNMCISFLASVLFKLMFLFLLRVADVTFTLTCRHLRTFILARREMSNTLTLFSCV